MNITFSLAKNKLKLQDEGTVQLYSRKNKSMDSVGHKSDCIFYAV